MFVIKYYTLLLDSDYFKNVIVGHVLIQNKWWVIGDQTAMKGSGIFGTLRGWEEHNLQ